MAQDITLLGASYSDVPAVTLPKTSGGTATFYDTSGTETVTQNGTYDTTSLGSLVVDTAHTGLFTFSVDSDGNLYCNSDADSSDFWSYDSTTGNLYLLSDGTGVNYESGTYEPTVDIARPTISFTNSHNEPPVMAGMIDVTNTSDTTTNTNWGIVIFNFYRAFGTGIYYSSTAKRYGTAHYIYRATSTTSLSTGTTHFTYNDDNSGSSSSAYARYWLTESAMMPYSASTSRYWRAGRTYKWYAVWKE